MEDIEKLYSVEEMDKEEIRIEAIKILNSDRPLESLKTQVLDKIIIGEDSNKQLISILLLSGKIPDWDMKQIILCKGESGGGKSRLMLLADAFKTKNVGRFTAHALDWTNLEDFEILRLKEIGFLDQETQGISTLKFVSSDDKGYTVECPVRDDKGLFTTVQHKIPPITVISSTTRVKIDPQLERRAWIINPDERREQTEQIRRYKGSGFWDKALKKLGRTKYTSLERAKMILEAVMNELEPMPVIVPFPSSLLKFLKSRTLRVRGDYDKLYAVVYLYALFNQKVLPTIDIDGRKAVITTPLSVYEVIKIAERPLITMTSGMEERERQLIKQLQDLEKTEVGDVIEKEDREKIAVRIGKSERTIRRWLRGWEIHGYMSWGSVGQKHEKKHKLLYSLEEIERTTSSLGDNNTLAGQSFCPTTAIKNMALEGLNRLSSLDKTILRDGNVMKHFKYEYIKKKTDIHHKVILSNANHILSPLKPSKTKAVAGQTACPTKNKKKRDH